MDKKTLDERFEESIKNPDTLKYFSYVLVIIFAFLIVCAGVLLFIIEEPPPALYFPNQDENGFFPICIDGFMAGCTPQGCVPSEPVIECQIINVNLGELE